MTLKSSIKSFRFYLFLPIMAFPVVPEEQLVGAPELVLELAFLFDEANIDENAANNLRKSQLVTLRAFSNVEQELPQVRAVLGEMFVIQNDNDMGLKLQLSRAVGVWQISRKRVYERDRLEDQELPGRGIVKDILEQLEEGELHIEQLSEAVSREQEDKSLRKSSTE